MEDFINGPIHREIFVAICHDDLDAKFGIIVFWIIWHKLDNLTDVFDPENSFLKNGELMFFFIVFFISYEPDKTFNLFFMIQPPCLYPVSLPLCLRSSYWRSRILMSTF